MVNIHDERVQKNLARVMPNNSHDSHHATAYEVSMGVGWRPDCEQPCCGRVWETLPVDRDRSHLQSFVDASRNGRRRMGTLAPLYAPPQ